MAIVTRMVAMPQGMLNTLQGTVWDDKAAPEDVDGMGLTVPEKVLKDITAVLQRARNKDE